MTNGLERKILENSLSSDCNVFMFSRLLELAIRIL